MQELFLRLAKSWFRNFREFAFVHFTPLSQYVWQEDTSRGVQWGSPNDSRFVPFALPVLLGASCLRLRRLSVRRMFLSE